MARRKGKKSGRSSAPNRKSRAGARKSSALTRKVAAKPNLARKPVPRPARHPRPRKSIIGRGSVAPLRTPNRLKPAMLASPYDIDLDRNPANYQPLTPLTFLERAASVFPERSAVIHGRRSYTYAEFY